MDLDKTLRILREAKGDPARISLASVDLLLAEQPESERENLRGALQVAAIPHWFDEKILEVLLDGPLPAEVQSLASQLRRLPVVEPFPARGPGAANVHETSRLALRSRMKDESLDRLAALSERAKIYFEGEAPHLRIEALYHGFTFQPEAAEQECAALYAEWKRLGRYEELLGLGVVLDELLAAGLPGGAVRNTVLYQIANIRYNYQPRTVTAVQAREALAEAHRSGVLWRIANANDLIADVLRDQGDLPGALEAYRASLAIRQRLTAQEPANQGWQRDLSVSQDSVAGVLRDQGDLAGALEAYRASLAIRQRLAAEDPANSRWRRDLSISQDNVPHILRDQGELTGALEAYHASLAIRQRLAAQDLANAGWQRDLSISQDNVANVLADQGDHAGALGAYRASLAIRQRLAAQDPDNAGWRHDLSISQNNVA